MLNQVVLVGRLTDEVKVETTENGKKVSSICLAVQRSFKNSDGIYDTDFVRCILWNGVAENTSEFCHKGDLVGIKGRIQVTNYTDQEDKKRTIAEVVAEKVTFLSNKKSESN